MQAAEKAGPARRRKSSARQTGDAILKWRMDGAVMISKEELAAHLRRSMSTIQRWERGAQEPRLSDLRAMEDYKPGLVALLFPKQQHQNGAARRA